MWCVFVSRIVLVIEIGVQGDDKFSTVPFASIKTLCVGHLMLLIRSLMVGNSAGCNAEFYQITCLNASADDNTSLPEGKYPRGRNCANSILSRGGLFRGRRWE